MQLARLQTRFGDSEAARESYRKGVNGLGDLGLGEQEQQGRYREQEALVNMEFAGVLED